DQLPRLGDDAVHGATAMPAADLGNDAERTGVIAALGNLDVGEMGWRQAEPRRVVIRDEGRVPGDKAFGRHRAFSLPGVDFADDRRHLRDLVEADESVDLR